MLHCKRLREDATAKFKAYRQLHLAALNLLAAMNRELLCEVALRRSLNRNR